jgi:transglutaminase-like putative cysteine protease
MEHDPAAQLGALFRFVRDRITFIGDVAGVETLQSPRYTLRVGAGDCDDRAILLAALARSIGVPTDLKFRAIAANPRAPQQFSHVYVVARVGNRDLPLDPTYHQAEPGYQYARPTRVEDLRL